MADLENDLTYISDHLLMIFFSSSFPVHNKLIRLPDSFVSLSNLEKLDLSSNRLELLPDNFHALQSLKELDLRGNPLKVAPDLSAKLTAFHVPPETLMQVLDYLPSKHPGLYRWRIYNLILPESLHHFHCRLDTMKFLRNARFLSRNRSRSSLY